MLTHARASQVPLSAVGLMQDVAHADVYGASDESRLMAGAGIH